MAARGSGEEDNDLWHRWRPWLIVSVAVLATLALLALALVILPPLLVPGGTQGPPAPAAGPSARPSPSLTQRSPTASQAGFADLAKAESDIRGNLVAALGVLAVLIGAVVGFLSFRETQRQNRLARQQDREQLELTRRGQVNERFSKAIEQLGQSADDKVDVRIGAIYSLEQIALDSEDLHWPIMEVLTAFLRANSKSSVVGAQESVEETFEHETGGLISADQAAAMSARMAAPPPSVPADLQAIVTVLGRRPLKRRIEEKKRHRQLNLSYVQLAGLYFADLDLGGADFVGAHLEGSNFGGAHLEGANFLGAHLKGANLAGAHLEGASLTRAHLEGAYLGGARLEDAWLLKAHLEKANLYDAHLENARLGGAKLQSARLNSAHLQEAVLLKADLNGADLDDAHLEGADLTEVTGLTLDQLTKTRRDDKTKLPPKLAEAAGEAHPDPR